MTVSRGIRRAWTGREKMLIQHFAAEGLSIGRTATALGTLYNIHVTVRQLRGFIHYHGIKFRGGPGGAPYGNQNAKNRGRRDA